MAATATYPGTVSPLRGLDSFTEVERDVFFGRDTDIEQLARLVTGKGFRAGLLHGEPGVGKTSLLRAGLVPHLRDHGMVALYCADIMNPIDSFVREVVTATGLTPETGEAPMMFLARVVANTTAGQMYLFILDDVDVALGTQDEEIIHALGDLFARVVTRSGGRARFLFSCASEHVHRFGALERRTGSLFPPSSRYQLERFSVPAAIAVLERMLSMAGVITDGQVAAAVAGMLGTGGQILPADMQLAALAVQELGIVSADTLAQLGGRAELERAWLLAGATATGNQGMALRLLAEVSAVEGACAPEWAAARASVDVDFARHAFAVLEQKSILGRVALPGAAGSAYMVASPLLLPQVREAAAPARAASQRAFELLGAKAGTDQRLLLRELRILRSEGITPVTPDERAVIERSKRFYLTVVAVVAAVPLVALAILYVIISDRYYFDVITPAGGGERIVVRAGRPSLTAFDWLPGSPDFGSIVADTGLSRPMVQDQAWSAARARALTGGLDDYGGATMDLLTTTNVHLIEYATTGSPVTLDQLHKAANDPQDLVALLDALRPIARGDDHEIRMVESALRDPSAAVQRAALEVAAAAAERREGLYHRTLAMALTATDTELRRFAFAVAEELGEDPARQLYQDALAENPEPAARRELLAALTTIEGSGSGSGSGSGPPSAATAVSILVNRDLPATTRDKARTQLRRGFSMNPAEATMAAAKLAGDSKAPPEDRALALELMRDFAPAETYADITADVKATLDAKAEPVRAAGLPLYARIAPREAAGELAVLLENQQASEPLRVAMALAWGEVARSKEKAAAIALEGLITDDAPAVRAAAAEAFGNVGRTAQPVLSKMVKSERFDVAVGAARGLAWSAQVGASSGAAISGIAQLFKRKGKQRRAAVEIYAIMARTQPSSVYSYLTAAARAPDDDGLHAIGVAGLCNAGAAGHKKSWRALERAAGSGLVEVRRVVIQCIVDHPGDPRTAASVAARLAGDSDSEVRTDAARVLAALAANGKSQKQVIDALARLALDDEREIRLLAIRALARLGQSAPADLGKAMPRLFERADEREKLVLLHAAREQGATDIIQQAIIDPSPQVRIAALDTAIATAAHLSATMSSALTDSDPEVRRAALERLARSQDKLDQGAINTSLRLAVGDRDPAIAQLALATLGRLGSSDEVATRLGRALAARSEHRRVQAAAAAIGLVERDVKKALELLSPLLEDPSHDVRVAMLPALASAWAVTHSPEQLAEMLRQAETHAMRRVAATAAFVVLARTEAGNQAAAAALDDIVKSGPPLARIHAKLAMGLISEPTDGIAFLELLVP